MPGQLTQTTRDEVLEAYGRECVFCEISEEEHKNQHGRSLDIHHLVPDRAGGSDDPENLIPLCLSCHRTMEAAHGKAMKQVAKESGVSNVDVEDYNELKKELQEKEEKLSYVIGELRAFDEDLNKAGDDRIQLLEWLDGETFSVKIHLVHERDTNTSRLLYAGLDRDDAQQRYDHANSDVTMETRTISDVPIQKLISENAVNRLHIDGNWWLDDFVAEIKPMIKGGE